jgi:hypothetical protein
MAGGFISKNWKLSMLPTYWAMNVFISYYRMEVDGVKERHIKYQNLQVISDNTTAIKGRFKKDRNSIVTVTILQTLVFGRLIVPLQLIALFQNHYGYNILTIHEHLPNTSQFNTRVGPHITPNNPSRTTFT